MKYTNIYRLFILCTALCASVSMGDTWTVDDDGLDFPKADYQDIQSAIDGAADGDEIIVYPGTYTSTSNEVVSIGSKDLILRGSDPTNPKVVATTIIDGEHTRLGIRVDNARELTIAGLTITRGFNNELWNANGGGLHLFCGAYPTELSNLVFIDNHVSNEDADPNQGARSAGGGAYILVNLAEFSSLNLDSCEFTNNSTTGFSDSPWSNGGGGLALDINSGTPTVTNCTFNSNQSITVGGGVFVYSSYSSGVLEIGSSFSNCEFSNNSAFEGGAGSFAGTWKAEFLHTITNCYIHDNTATNGGGIHETTSSIAINSTLFESNISTNGGALYLTHSMGQTIDQLKALFDCDFITNEAFEGGAIYMKTYEIGSYFQLNESRFTQNTAVFGGAIYNDAGDFIIAGSDFDENGASYGGGFYNDEGTGTVTDSTFSSHTVYQGGAIFNWQGTSEISGSVFASNFAEDRGASIYNLVSYSDIDNTLFCSNWDSFGATAGIYGAWGDGGGVVVLSECEDCDENGNADWDEIHQEPSLDCNNNSLLDSCEITDGTVLDCNDNYIPDSCDLTDGTSEDCNANSIPDECEIDCNGNGTPDDCDIAKGAEDCDGNGIPDSCEADCNDNGIADACDIADGTSEDCNENGVPDWCDITYGGFDDNDGNGVPDVCECLADINGDGLVNVSDVLTIIADWGSTAGVPADINHDGIVDVGDLLEAISSWGEC